MLEHPFSMQEQGPSLVLVSIHESGKCSSITAPRLLSRELHVYIDLLLTSAISDGDDMIG